MRTGTVCAMVAVSLYVRAAAGAPPDPLRAVEDAFRGDDRGARLAALESLRGNDSAKAAAFLLRVIKEKDANYRETWTAVDVLVGFSDPGAADLVLRRLNSNPHDVLLLEAAGRMRLEKARPLFGRVLGSRAAATRPAHVAAALRALGRFPKHDPKVSKAIVARLDPGEYHGVRRAAAEALGGLAYRGVFPVLQKYLHDRQIGSAVEESLFRLTGQDFKDDAGKWDEWWSANGRSFTPLNTALEAARRTRKTGRARRERQTYFYGVQLSGKNILFVLDKSASMHGSRMGKLKQEILQTIGAMAPDMSCGILFFGLSFERYPRVGVGRITRGFQSKCRSFVAKVTPDGPTPVENAMDKAFRDVEKSNIDTIYLLSDGNPTDSMGRPVDEAALREKIAAVNAEYDVSIHTFSIGGSSAFLRAVAGDNCGEYVEVE